MILSIDQGTTGTTVLLFDQQGEILARSYAEFTQYYPKPGWVEHDACEIWDITLGCIRQVIQAAEVQPADLKGIGITNQRETTVLWDRRTGKPVHKAIVWQCRRSRYLCEKLIKEGHEKEIEQTTGLVVDAYFSGTKLMWMFAEEPELRQRAEAGELCFGTIDSWLIWNLTQGQSHVTDPTNASRTLMYDIKEKSWSSSLCDVMGVPGAVLPEVKPSAGIFGYTDEAILGARVPISGVAGDQQAALFGQCCVEPGQVKNTYGTGCFVLMYTGEVQCRSRHGLLTTIACDAYGQPAYALEGAVFTAGAAVQWLRDEMKMIEHASDTQAIAESIESTQGVYLVPAFTGLGAPYWDMQARGSLVGLSRGAGRAEVVRATLESIAYQTRDLVEAMSRDAGQTISHMRVDGGACANDFLMQFQADMLDGEIQRPVMIESTALGAAMLAGIGVNLWDPQALPDKLTRVANRFLPQMNSAQRERHYEGWKRAVARTVSQ